MMLNIKKCILAATIAIMICLTVLPVRAESNTVTMTDRINGMLKNPVIYDDFVKIAEAADNNIAEDIYFCMMTVYPDFIEISKKCKDNPNWDANSRSAGVEKRIARAVDYMMNSPIVFDDFKKLCEAVDTGAVETYTCVIEIFPDFITQAKNGFSEADSLSPLSATLTSGFNDNAPPSENTGYYILSAACGVVFGAGAATVIFAIVNKKKAKVEK